MMRRNSSIRRWFYILVLSLPLFGSACFEVKVGNDDKQTSTIKGCESFGFVGKPEFSDSPSPNAPTFAVKITTQPSNATILADGQVGAYYPSMAWNKGEIHSSDIFRIDPAKGAPAGTYTFTYKITGSIDKESASSSATRTLTLTEGCNPSRAASSGYNSIISSVATQSDGSLAVTVSTDPNSPIAAKYTLELRTPSGYSQYAVKENVAYNGVTTFSKAEQGSATALSVFLKIYKDASPGQEYVNSYEYIYIVPGPGALKPGDPIVKDDEITTTVGALNVYHMLDNDKLPDVPRANVSLEYVDTSYSDENRTPGPADVNFYNVNAGNPGYILVRYNRPGTYRTRFTTKVEGYARRPVQFLTARVSPGSSLAKDDTITGTGLVAFKKQILDVLANDGFQSGKKITAVELVSSACGGGGCYAVDMQIDGSVLKFTGSPGYYVYKYTAQDDKGNTGTANVAVELVNVAPVAIDDSATGQANQDIRIDVLRHDEDENINTSLLKSDMLRIHFPFKQPDQQGGFVWENANNLMFKASAAGTYTFYYQAEDSFGALSNWATVTVTVTATATAPNVAPGINSFTTSKSTVIHDPLAGPYDETFTATCAATDANGDTLTYGLTGDGVITNTGTGTWTVNPAPAGSGNLTYTCTVYDGKGGSASSSATVYVTTTLYGHSLPNIGAMSFENVAVGNIAEFTFTAPATASDLIIGCSAFRNPPAGGGPPTVISVNVVPLAGGSWSGAGCAAASSLQIMVPDGVPNIGAFTYTPGQRYVVYLSNAAGGGAMDIHCDVSAWYPFTLPGTGLAPMALPNVVRGVNPGGACP